MANILEREIARLSNLKNYKSMSPEELAPLAQKNLVVREFKSTPIFSNDKEQKLAETRFKNYLENNEIENVSNIDTLKSLVFNEIFEIRIQGELNKLDEDGNYPPDKLIKSLVEVQKQKSSLKVKLGIDRKDDEVDDLSALQLLQKRVHKHIQENKNEFTLWVPWTCEKCGHSDIESYLIYKRVKDFSKMKHPFFAGRYLFSYPILKFVKNGILTKAQAWEILSGAGMGGDYKIPPDDKKWCEDYIQYCLDNFTMITDLLKKN